MNYALLVGINAYKSDRISNLEGCENDVDLLASYLEERSDIEIEIHSLKSAEATRQAIIDAFRSHLSKAKAGEQALFYFSGHGSKVRSPEVFVDYQRDEFHENLVCHDSRTDGIYDLADKEVKVLIGELTDKGVEVIVIFDCCHAGSGTRAEQLLAENTTIREVPKRRKTRPLESFLPGSAEQLNKAPDHIAFAACGPREFSRETAIGTEQVRKHGVFTYCLIQLLRSKQSQLSYEQLLYACRNAVRQRLGNIAQTPQMDVVGKMDARALFLQTGADSRPTHTHLMYFDKQSKKWKVPLGRVHGLMIGQTARFLIYKDPQLSQELGTASTQSIGLYESNLTLEFDELFLLNYQTYTALPTFLPIQRLPVYCKDHRSDVKALLDVTELASAKEFRAVSVSRQEFQSAIDLEAPSAIASYELSIEEDSYQILYRDSQNPVLDVRIPRWQDEQLQFETTAKLLMHIVAWERMRSLHHPRTDLWREQAEVQISFCELRTRYDHVASEITLDFDPKEGVIDYELSVLNTSRRSLYVKPFYLSRDFRVDASLEMRLIPNDGRSIIIDDDALTLPIEENPHLRQITDSFILLFSQEELPYLNIASPLSLEEVYRGQGQQYRAKAGRDFSNAWFTHPIHIKILLSLGSIGLQELNLANGRLKIQPHETFRAQVGLASSAAELRGPQSDRFLQQYLTSQGLELVDFSETGKRETILEIHHIEHKESLKETPLQIEVSVEEDSCEFLACLTLPAELSEELSGTTKLEEAFRLPVLGLVKRDESGLFRFSLQEIPANPPDGRAQAGRSLKLQFVKLGEGKVSLLDW